MSRTARCDETAAQYDRLTLSHKYIVAVVSFASEMEAVTGALLCSVRLCMHA